MEFAAHFLAQPETYVSLLTLTLLEIILGIDNIVFITILAGKLPEEKQKRARQIGLAVALITRLLLLLSITWVMQLKAVLFTLFGIKFTGKDLILIGGGLFLMAKAVHEIYENVERPEEHQAHHLEEHMHVDAHKVTKAMMTSFLIQVSLLDIVFSLDSVITAVGLVGNIWIMATAVIVAVIFMIVFAGPIGDFVQQRPSIRVLALSFLVLIGFLLITEGFHKPMPKGYIYFAMGFSLLVQLINLRMRSRAERQKAKKEAAAATAGGGGA